MRKLMIVLAIATTLASGAIGRAEGELATCSDTAPTRWACKKSFTLTEEMAVNVRLVPDLGYTGSLMARLEKGTNHAPVSSSTAGAYFVAGQATPLATNFVPETTVLLQPGNYTLVVESAKLLKVCGFGCPDVPMASTYAAGKFGAIVIPTDSAA